MKGLVIYYLLGVLVNFIEALLELYESKELRKLKNPIIIMLLLSSWVLFHRAVLLTVDEPSRRN